ncbi:hypothetical protein LCM23_13105 [Cytobacillus kochii]|uniref:helix-hairpin-helix domain-containing protein n=1 Tax=Cytobacillus kochii TaxID=859143 RepID=UPI001CD2F688|nr:hypothetical protein [Cytobacillus kochii]MCA1027033.1 hypothetical protein [Cytobacillus kochii]
MDTEGSKRNRIIGALKKHFGEDRVLQIATFGTEGSKSAIQTACRGLGIDSDVGLYLAGMIPFERGSNWSLNDCFNGHEEKERKPIKEFIREVDKYPYLKETALKIEGLVNKRSSHAGGIFIFNEHYVKTSALMKTPKGANITQFNMGDAEAMGNIKFDLLTIEGLDKIRVTLDQLLEHNEIEWQGSIRKTYKKYIHPDTLDYDNPKIWEMVGKGEVMDLFQFSTDIGLQSVTKVKPKSLLEAAVTNSLMRLMSDGDEQPVDTFVKYKNNISLWYEEMGKAGLSKDEIAVLETYLKDLYGVADTQEVVMQMVMDEKISGFDIKESNYLRKSIAKKKADVLKEVQELFFKKGKEMGASNQLLNYVWNVQIKRQLGYSFSILHTLAYTVIALQELNLIFKYNPLYWNTACLTVNSGGIESDQDDDDSTEEESKNKKKYSTNYGKVAAAIGNIRQRGVKVALPDINKAKFGFSPDLENDSIIFGLKGMNGIGDDVVNLIIKHRPYSSFEDFYERMFETKLVKKGQLVQLIKGGCFSEYGDSKSIMEKFAQKLFEPKKTLNMQNMPMLLNNEFLPEDYHFEGRLYKYKKYISQFVCKTLKNPKDRLFKLDDISQQFFQEYFTDESVVEYSDDGSLIISEKKFTDEYNEKIKEMKDWMSKENTLKHINSLLYGQLLDEYMNGTVSKWEMDSLSFYYHEHELAAINKEKYGLSTFSQLPENPIVVNEYVSKGIPRKEFQLNRIAGTVLDKDKNKHQITILTTDGVVTVKFYAGAFSHYNQQLSKPISKDKKEVVEASWFTRGNKLIITGFRRGNKFIPRKYKNSIYQHTVAMIDNIDQEGNLIIKTERKEI